MENQFDLFSGEVNLPKREYEYFLLLSPGNSIGSKVAGQKIKLHKEIGISSENLHSLPHISFFKFHNFETENLIMPLIEKALVNVKSFEAEINSLEVFDHGNKKSLVLNFKNPEPFCEINNRLLDGLSFSPKHAHKPHLTIARSVPAKDFRKIKHLEDYKISGSFLCNNVTVLRKELGKKSRYEKFGQVDLAENPVAA